MTSHLAALCIDSTEPELLGRFWAEALRRRVEASGVDLRIVPNDGTTFDVVIRKVTEGKRGRNRNHLDLTTTSDDDKSDPVRHLVAMGATHIDVGQSAQDTHVVLADPEGNELCIIDSRNRFLDGCGRLGAINCDGTRATGVFWSAVLGVNLFLDEGEETALRVPGTNGPIISWSGPPLLEKLEKNRLHLDITPDDGDRDAEIDRLISLGATILDNEVTVAPVFMADPDGNEFRVVSHPLGLLDSDAVARELTLEK